MDTDPRAGFGATRRVRRTKPYPSVLGFMDTELKKNAHQDLTIGPIRPPLAANGLLAVRKRKIHCPDNRFRGRWSRKLDSMERFTSFWGHFWIAESAGREPNPSARHQVSYSENRTVLDLSIYDEASANSHYRFAINGNPTKAQGYLDEISARALSSRLTHIAQGDYRIDLAEERGGRRIPFPAVGYTLAYDLK